MQCSFARTGSATYNCIVVHVTSSIDANDLAAVREIFFLSSSRQNFSSEEEKAHFFDKWTKYYLDSCADRALVAKDLGGRVMGYLMGCADSGQALPYFQEQNKSYALFADLFERFPAHLHLNCHPEARNMGVGSRLIEAFVQRLKSERSKGVHIVTSPESENCAFYRKNGFQFELMRHWRERPLLFMGRGL